MVFRQRPYLIVPKLIEQPTWGGSYILKLKGWVDRSYLKNKKIGQSYELFSQSKLLVKIVDSQDPRFIAELGVAYSDIITNSPSYRARIDYVNLPSITKYWQKIPLIKITQALGNSFQIHIKPSATDRRWRPKAESWYFFEDGLITFGLKKNVDLNRYKSACKVIEKKMKELSRAVKSRQVNIEEARNTTKQFIKKINPWQYVNLHRIKKDSLVDASSGGIHHSWEEDKKKFPLGNILYEIQQDVMDPVSTLRAFDQGKIGDKGELREININDYFKFIDVVPRHNDLAYALTKRKGNRLVTTKHYCLDLLESRRKQIEKTNGSFYHLFVYDGEAVIAARDGFVHLTKGHSCFIPESVVSYIIKPNSKKVTILKTFIEV